MKRTLVFISYRTCDEPWGALAIDKALCRRFGSDRVFRDCRSIRPGRYFPPEISDALRQCRALVAVIGERWLRKGPDGRRLIDHPRDYVRLELAEALRRNILVVPVLVGDTSLPPVSALPAEISGLAGRQYRHLRHRDADYDLARLADELADLLGFDQWTGPGDRPDS